MRKFCIDVFGLTSPGDGLPSDPVQRGYNNSQMTSENITELRFTRTFSVFKRHLKHNFLNNLSFCELTSPLHLMTMYRAFVAASAAYQARIHRGGFWGVNPPLNFQ